MAFVQNLNLDSCPQPMNIPILNNVQVSSADFDIPAGHLIRLDLDNQVRNTTLTVTESAGANDRYIGYSLEAIPFGQTGTLVTSGIVEHPSDAIVGGLDSIRVGQKLKAENINAFAPIISQNDHAIGEIVEIVSNGTTGSVKIFLYSRDPRIDQLLEETDYAIINNQMTSAIAVDTFIPYDDTHNNRQIEVSALASANQRFVGYVVDPIPGRLATPVNGEHKGRAIINGIITGINTSALAVGNRVKVASPTTVELADATGDNVIGIVITSAANGTILLDGNGVDKHINAALADFGSFAWQNQQTSSSVNGHANQTFPADTITAATESILEPTSDGSEIQDGEIFLTTTTGIIRFVQTGRYKIVIPALTWNFTKSSGTDTFVTSTVRLIGEVNSTNRTIYENIYEDQSTLTSSAPVTVLSPEKEFTAVFQAGELLRIELLVNPTVAFTGSGVSTGLTNRFRINAGNFYYEVIQLM